MLTDSQIRIAEQIRAALAQGRFFTVSAEAIFADSNRWRTFEAWAEDVAEECKCDVSWNWKSNTYIFTPKEQMAIEDVSFRAGFEAAKNGAIICARQSEHWNLYERNGCKAVQHSIELMNLLDASRFNHDGSMKPEPTIEYDRTKHGPVVNGKVQVEGKSWQTK